MSPYSPLLLASAALLACAGPGAKGGALRCNGDEARCDRRLDQVTFAATHNAMSSEERGWLGPNQHVAVPAQLEAGVRGLNLDTHLGTEGEAAGVAQLCHGYCSLGSQPLVEGLGEIRAFLDENPDEVLIITFEAYVDAATTEAAFAESGLLDLVLHHEAGEPWPTLAEMIEGGERVAVWTSDGGAESGWYLDQWTYWVDNPYSYKEGDPFTCGADRGEITNDLYNLNHFVTDPIANAELAAVANARSALEEHIRRCEAETGRLPNQVLVDFFDEGDVLDVVEALEGPAGLGAAAGTTGRRSPHTVSPR